MQFTFGCCCSIGSVEQSGSGGGGGGASAFAFDLTFFDFYDEI